MLCGVAKNNNLEGSGYAYDIPLSKNSKSLHPSIIHHPSSAHQADKLRESNVLPVRFCCMIPAYLGFLGLSRCSIYRLWPGSTCILVDHMQGSHPSHCGLANNLQCTAAGHIDIYTSTGHMLTERDKNQV